MVQDVKRGRGRPRGSGKPDGTTLRQMAELLAEDPRLKPTTAIKRVIGTKNDSDIRRLQVKWKAEGSILLSQARDRRETRRVNVSTSPWHDLKAMRAALDAMNPSPAELASLRAMMNPSPAELASLRAMMNPSPAELASLRAMMMPSKF